MQRAGASRQSIQSHDPVAAEKLPGQDSGGTVSHLPVPQGGNDPGVGGTVAIAVGKHGRDPTGAQHRHNRSTDILADTHPGLQQPVNIRQNLLPDSAQLEHRDIIKNKILFRVSADPPKNRLRIIRITAELLRNADNLRVGRKRHMLIGQQPV